jgi:orotidine-5'-phosphate decarboxylase
MKTFLDKFYRLFKEKNTILCVGLDPALPKQRDDNVIPSNYIEGHDENETRLNFCLDIIDKVADYAIAVKLNEQYMFGISMNQHQEIADYLKRRDLLSIYDCKLGDIAESAESKIFWINKAGYDAITSFVQPGNLEQMIHFAHSCSPTIGIIAITLMSNPEARKYFLESKFGSSPLCYEIANDVRKCDADGCVVGSTKHILAETIKKIRSIIGNEKIILFPGIGAQKGDIEKTVRFGGSNIIINVGRKIIYSNNPEEVAKEYSIKFNEIKSTR